MQQQIEALVAEHGTVPPPWVVYLEHPYSICWRMGAGESHCMLWWEWWSEQDFSEQARVEYFRRWPPPPYWLDYVITAIWDVDTLDEASDLAPYFERTRALGLGSYEDYQSDLADPKWLER